MRNEPQLAERAPITHQLKSWPEFFGPITQGVRTHELRRNDRPYRVGDFFQLNEYEPEAERYTGRSCVVEITSQTSNKVPCAVSPESLHQDFSIFSIRLKPGAALAAGQVKLTTPDGCDLSLTAAANAG